VSVRVVVILESVEVEHHADEYTTAACSGELPGDVTLELPTVRQSGERVRVGQHVHLLEEPGVLDRNGGLVTECAEQLQVLGGKGVPAHACQCTEHLRAVPHRRRCHACPLDVRQAGLIDER